MYVSPVGKLSMSSANKLSYNYSNRLYLSYPIDDENVNVIALYFTLKLVPRLLVILHTTLLSLHIYYMPHHARTVHTVFLGLEKWKSVRCQ